MIEIYFFKKKKENINKYDCCDTKYLGKSQ